MLLSRKTKITDGTEPFHTRKIEMNHPIERAGLLMTILIFAGLAPAADEAGNSPAAAQQALIGVAGRDGAARPRALAQDHWFPQAGLGMFIHWGLASLGGHHDLSWGMMKDTPWDKAAHNQNKLKPSEYFALVEQFQPTNFHPDKWLKAAKEAGFEYAVLTTRHHEGFALWPSEFGDFSTKNFMGGRDLVAQYVAACRKNGLRVGFYYSPPDWHYERAYRSWGYKTQGTAESPHLGLNHEPLAQLLPKPADYESKYVAYINGQLRELLTRYGPVDYLWFDGSAGKDVLSIAAIRALQPGIIVNDRQHGVGDVRTELYECQLPKEHPPGTWEHCFSMTGTMGEWGYTQPEHCSSAAVLLSHLARVRGWGGNVLANYGPRPDGEMPDCYYANMSELKGWMNQNGAAIHGVEAGPYPGSCNVPVSVKGTIWYAYLVPENPDVPPVAGPIVLKGMGKPAKVVMLASGKEIPATVTGNECVIEVPADLRSASLDVVAIEWK